MLEFHHFFFVNIKRALMMGKQDYRFYVSAAGSDGPGCN
jgi:hypothetical protein